MRVFKGNTHSLWELLTMAKGFGRRVAERRKALKLTQRQLAEQCGLSVNWVSLIERGVAENVSRGAFTSLLMALGVPPHLAKLAFGIPLDQLRFLEDGNMGRDFGDGRYVVFHAQQREEGPTLDVGQWQLVSTWNLLSDKKKAALLEVLRWAQLAEEHDRKTKPTDED